MDAFWYAANPENNEASAQTLKTKVLRSILLEAHKGRAVRKGYDEATGGDVEQYVNQLALG